MRTTVSLDDDLLIELRRCAAALQMPLSEVMNRALRRGLRDLAIPASEQRYATITFGTPAGEFTSAETQRAADEALEGAHLTSKLGIPSPSP